MEIACSAQSPLNCPVYPIRKLDGFWSMTVDYRELNTVMPLIHAAMSNIVLLTVQLVQVMGVFTEQWALIMRFLASA